MTPPAQSAMSKVAYRREAMARVRAHKQHKESVVGAKRIRHNERHLNRLRLKGLEYADRRTIEYKAMKRWEAGVRAQLGGTLTALQEADVKLASTTQMILGNFDFEIMKLQSILNGHRQPRLKTDVKLLLQLRATYANDLGRALTRLGLRKQDVQPLPSLRG